RVTTYGEIARALGTGAYRAVGGAMNRNPHAPEVACHRVVGKGGKIGGFAHAIEIKVDLLKGEGVEVKGGVVVDFEEKFFKLID
ncbi:MGMT family protein, partial [Candidatus Peregrinibacteria bacterium]|nr:MGMT family protein [Candidatus Peregrinibacteria bacterium]